MTSDVRTDDITDAACRAALITQCFPPEPTPVPLNIARALRDEGLVVDVLTGMPNYPTGKLHKGYPGWRRTTEVTDQLRILRTPLYPSHDHSVAGRAANYLSYAASSALLGSQVLRSADVAVVYSSPATAATAAMAAKLRWKTPYIVMIMDLWPDSVFASGFLTDGLAHRLSHAALRWFTDRTYRWADHVTVTSPGMRDAVIARGVQPSRVSVVYNWVDEKIMQPTEPDHDLRQRLGLSDEFLIMYGGNQGRAQGLDVAIRAMAQLRDLPDVHLVMVGDGIERPALQSLAQDLRLRTVHFVDPMAPERMPAAMASADIHLASLADEALFRITMPSKVQSILACGQPILVSAPGDAAQVVHDSCAGFTAPPGDPVGLADAIRQARRTPPRRLREMGDAGRAYYMEHMSEARNSQLLAEIVNSAARRYRKNAKPVEQERR